MDKKEEDHYFLLFYFNPKDKRVFVPKRYGIGWTVNLANPIAIILLLATIALTYWLAF